MHLAVSATPYASCCKHVSDLQPTILKCLEAMRATIQYMHMFGTKPSYNQCCSAGHYPRDRCHHNLVPLSGLDCILHHPPVLAAALHLDWEGHNPENGLQDWVLHLLSGCCGCNHSAVAGVPPGGESLLLYNSLLMSVSLWS